MSLKPLFAAACLAASIVSATPAFAQPQAQQAAAPTRFSVVVEGTGPDVILIPGLSSPRAVWDGARAALGGKYRLHLIELHGFGGTPARANANAGILAGSVAELAAYIETNGLRRPAVVGHSMGGLMALMLAKAAPDAAGKLLIVDALPFIGTLFDPNATVATIEPRAELMRTMMAAPSASAGQRRAAASAMAANMARTDDARTKVAEWAGGADPAVAAQAMYEDMVTDMRPMLPQLKLPITMVYPWDAARIPEVRAGALYAAAYAGAPNVRFEAVADSYHFVMLDQPARFNAILKDFLAGED